jgi:outer membrane protein OmpA-like peptidoglycan-associated protein
LNKLGDFLRDHPNSYVVLSGYTDIKGSDEYNLWLARRRADNKTDGLKALLWAWIGALKE